MNDLAACPFCGANQDMEDHLNLLRRQRGEMPVLYAPELMNIASAIASATWAVFCHNCGIHGQPQETSYHYAESSAKLEAVRLWNEREPAWKEAP